MYRCRFIPCVVPLVAWLGARPAAAAALDFTPTRVELVPGQASASLEVANRGGGTAVQVRAFLWTQQGDRDQLTPTDDLIVAPPIFTLPEGESQLIRLLLRTRTSGPASRAYRLLIDEVPPPGRNRQVTFAIRASIPVFVDPAEGGRIDLQWRAEGDGGSGAVLAARNLGPRFAVVNSVDVLLPSGRREAAKPLGQNGYVLPGAERHWRVPDPAARGARMHLIVATQAGKAEQDVQAAP